MEGFIGDRFHFGRRDLDIRKSIKEEESEEVEALLKTVRISIFVDKDWVEEEPLIFCSLFLNGFRFRESLGRNQKYHQVNMKDKHHLSRKSSDD